MDRNALEHFVNGFLAAEVALDHARLVEPDQAVWEAHYTRLQGLVFGRGTGAFPITSRSNAPSPAEIESNRQSAEGLAARRCFLLIEGVLASGERRYLAYVGRMTAGKWGEGIESALVLRPEHAGFLVEDRLWRCSTCKGAAPANCPECEGTGWELLDGWDKRHPVLARDTRYTAFVPLRRPELLRGQQPVFEGKAGLPARVSA
jgi:hypothetical protein